jgi:hypothetical protein
MHTAFDNDDANNNNNNNNNKHHRRLLLQISIDESSQEGTGDE